jgi:hypothetical protein
MNDDSKHQTVFGLPIFDSSSLAAPPEWQLENNLRAITADAVEFNLTVKVIARHFAEQNIDIVKYEGQWLARIHGVNGPFFDTFHELLAWLLKGGADEVWEKYKAAQDE